MEKQLFMLLRLGLGTGTPEKEDLSGMQALVTGQWNTLHETALSQGVAGIVLDGIDKISSFGLKMPGVLMKQWIGEVVQSYEARNMKQLVVIDNIQKLWSECGIRMMLMKGNAMATYYPVPQHRSPGDIDCYLFKNYSKGNEMARSWADNVDEGWYKHSQILYQEELIENHQYFSHTREGKSGKKLEQVLIEKLSVDSSEFGVLPGTNVLVPPPMFNALFLTYHALTHFLEEGLKLKQILDWAMFLQRDADKVDWPEFYRICNKYHLRRFADVTTDIAVHYLGVQINNPQIAINSPYTQKVLHSTLYDKDYVFSSGKRGWANRWHIVKNLFKYRWKYYQIYQHTVFRQLWFYATGYFFKTE